MSPLDYRQDASDYSLNSVHKSETTFFRKDCLAIETALMHDFKNFFKSETPEILC